jgi:hypothetical protein
MCPPAAVVHKTNVYAAVVGTTGADGRLFTYLSADDANENWFAAGRWPAQPHHVGHVDYPAGGHPVQRRVHGARARQ